MTVGRADWVRIGSEARGGKTWYIVSHLGRTLSRHRNLPAAHSWAKFYMHSSDTQKLRLEELGAI